MTTTVKTLIRAPQSPERLAAARMTGRYLVTLQPDGKHDVSDKLNKIGIKTATPLPHLAATAKPMADGAHILLKGLNIALVDPSPEQEDAFHNLAAREQAVIAVEPERIRRIVSPSKSDDYVRGWRDALDAFSNKFLEGAPEVSPRLAEAQAELVATWGLTAIKALDSQLTGSKIKLAVLDTGMDTGHPDFVGRQIVTHNFVGDGALFHDGVGHGTHCVGTAAGPAHPAMGPRYGIASEALIYAGRVLDDEGSGGDFNILQGIDWAVTEGCAVLSLSLGGHWFPGDPPFNTAYEAAATRALAAGSLLVVAAGNDADDDRFVGAVGTPGNCPSVLTVAAVDRNLATAPFSNRLSPRAPGVKGPDIAGPGVDVYSSWPLSKGRYNTISGTSMATPHVAGVAALFAQLDPALRGQALKNAVLNHAKPLPEGFARIGEIGRGLVQAPTGAGVASVHAPAVPARARKVG